MINQDDIDLL